MKKSLLVSLVLLSCVLLVGCGKKSEENLAENISETASDTQVSEWENAEENVNLALNCEEAIKKYLDGADKEWNGEWIKNGDNIVVDYIGRLEDGSVFDTSIESIAKACWKYSEGRDYTEWLSFEVGAGQMIKWFDNGVVGMKLGQTKTVQFGPDEWYGQVDPEYIITYTKDEIGDLSMYNVWDYFQPNPYAYGTITSITDKDLTVDFNHELAGKDLIFDITVKSITPYVPVSDVTPSTIAG